MTNRNQKDNSIQHVFKFAESVSGTSATFDTTSLFDDYNKTLEKLYVFNSDIQLDTSGKNSNIVFGPGSFTIELDFTKSFFN